MNTADKLVQIQTLREAHRSPGDFNATEKALSEFVKQHFIPTLDDVRALQTKYANRVFEQDGVLCIYDSALVDWFIETTQTTWSDVGHEEIRIMMQEFFLRNQSEVTDYAEEKENFFVFRAVKQAKDEGKKIVLMENLS